MLRVEDLHTHFISRDLDNQLRVARALNGVSFTVAPGRILGVVGETGAGKSLTAMSILGLLREPAQVVAGRALFEGRDLLALPPAELNRLRGSQLSLVVQSPKSSLDPLARIGDQLVRVQRAHRRVAVSEARARALSALRDVGIAGPERVMRAWAHELSGGMAQRVLLAIALVNEPRLLVADEPTTGLDVTVQAQILDLLRDTVRGRGIGAMIITHDLGVVAHYCDDMIVMFAGHVVESGPVAEVFSRPGHPYARTLIAAASETRRPGGAPALGGPPPNLYALPAGCCYRDRCAIAQEVCGTAPALRSLGPEQAALCHFAGQRLPEEVA
ncbi:ABC transporter ATP-binding protein [Roseomonas sp. BN140053]|uniref:ABC transporter ATP-binding protein n=1 Tax=Roseomonas sp. BN140053 TaxID=3391898 RepID=UPI0039EA88DA